MVTSQNITIGSNSTIIHNEKGSSCVKDIRSHVVAFTPSMWGDTFSSYNVDEKLQGKYTEAIERLKEEARKLLINETSTRLDKLLVIDTFERLGVSYHFDKEIEEQLELIFKHRSDSEDGDLFGVALEFRILRQHRYPVSCGVFVKFKDVDNKFDEAISSNVEGLLSLYEAAQARTYGEEILDEAVSFAIHNLNLTLPRLESPLKEKVKQALEQSLHRGVPIIQARQFISIYEKDEKKKELLVNFAKLNFNFLQNLYKKELYDLSRWWNEFDLKSKLPYARDRLVECYFWGLAFHFEPQYAFVRSAAAKVIKLISLLDDTYDNYATIEEGRLFTQILERWDIEDIDVLPVNMKILYEFMWNWYEDLEREARKQGKMCIMPHIKDAVKQTGRAYMKELMWFNGRQVPEFDEYFANTEGTSCLSLMFLPCFIGMPSASLETIDWVMSAHKLLLATSKAIRHVQNLGSCERESRDGEMPTAIDCYMKQHNTSREETLRQFTEQANDAWKELGMERLKVPEWIRKDIVDLFLNHSRAAEITYKNCVDGYTYPEKSLGPQIAHLLLDPIL